MRCITFSTSFLILSLSLVSVIYAAPLLFGSMPANNSYVSGGPRNFQINITEGNLNTSSAVLYVKAIDEASFEKFLMLCSNLSPSEWVCNTTVPFGIVGSDTVEVFYFNASDNLGNIGNNGTSGNPLKVTIDKNPPNIAYINPLNRSWVKGIVKIELSASDASSGINFSAVNYSFDYSVWKSMMNNSNFYADWDTSGLSNNQTITVYSKASDNVGNTQYAWVNVSVDNEIPEITVVRPSQDQEVSGTIQLQINATDKYSGISIASFSVGSLKRNMDCTGNICDEYLDTKLVNEGNNTIVFNVSDKAGNSASASVNVLIDNTQPSVSIENPKDNAYVSGKVFINASVTNPSAAVQYLQLLIEKPGYSSSWMSMSNAGGYRYYHLLDTEKMEEGIYKITARIVSTLNILINNSITLNIDRTKPLLAITAPELYVKGVLYPQFTATDEFKMNSTTSFAVSGLSGTMGCTEQLGGKKITCNATVNSTALTDDEYVLVFYAQDQAGNTNSISKKIKVDNNPPVLVYLKIEPTATEKPSSFKFYLYSEDRGSGVKTSRLAIQYPNGLSEILDLNLSSSGIWVGERFINSTGIHTVDVEARDFNGNNLTLTKSGYFYIGSINCGNGICESNENFCICSNDCPSIKCKANEVVDCGSGIPKCHDGLSLENILKNISTATPSTTTKEKPAADTIFNLKIILPVGLGVVLIVAIVLLVIGKARQKPWHESISKSTLNSNTW